MLTVKGRQGFGKVSESRHFAGADDEGARKFVGVICLQTFLRASREFHEVACVSQQKPALVRQRQMS